MRIPARVVDVLPQRLWRPGNVYLRARLHFCVDTGVGEPVRTVEWKGREIGLGRRPFKFFPESAFEDETPN